MDEQLAKSRDHVGLTCGGFDFSELEGPFCIEIFAGSGRLTAALRNRGLDAFGIDWKGGKIQPETAALLHLDLTIASEVAKLMRLLDHPSLVYVHLAPPCGTASRARGIRPGPPPLRSERFPMGVPGLRQRSARDATRVEAANALYELTARVIIRMTQRNIAWSLENPSGSLFWLFPAVAAALRSTGASRVDCQSCMWGSGRPKWTAFAYWPAEWMACLHRRCDGRHPHRPWGKLAGGGWATAQECVYPQRLCQAISDALLRFLQRPRGPPLPIINSKIVPRHKKRARPDRAAAGIQPRGAKAVRLLPEFEKVIPIRVSCAIGDPRARAGFKWPKCSFHGVHIPEGSRTVRVIFAGAGDTKEEDEAASNEGWAEQVRPSVASFKSTLPPLPRGFTPSAQAADRTSPRGARASLRLPTRGCIRDVSYHVGPEDVYIGREHRLRSGRFLPCSPWHNPFKLAACRDRSECVEKFRAHLLADAHLCSDLAALAGKRLLCHCPQWASCHGDVIIEEFAARHVEMHKGATIFIGIHSDPATFTSKALMVEHPFEAIVLEPALLDGITLRATRSVAEVTSRRRAALAHWTSVSRSLEVREAALHRAMHPEVEAVMANKRLLLLREMLRAIGFPSTEALFHCLCAGFPVVGEFPRTGVFPPDDRRPERELTDLWRSSRQAVDRLLREDGGSGDPEVDEFVLDESLLEVERGWLEGPFSPEDLNEDLGHWIPNRRFGVRQGGCCRAIDDFSESGVNSALGAVETIDPDNLDRVIVNAKAHIEAFCAADHERSEQSPFRGLVRHPDHEQAVLVARMFDLASAYRQLARAPWHASVTVIAVWHPGRIRWVFFKQRALAFGSSASVLSFNWVSKALSMVIVQVLFSGSTCFYDDFTVLEVQALASSTDESITELFALLGFDLKDLPTFADVIEPLGAVLDLRASRDRPASAFLANRVSRIDEIERDVGALCAADSGPTLRTMAKIRGRLLFSRSLCFGRVGGNAMRAITVETSRSTSASGVSEELRSALRSLVRHLRASPPRLISVAEPTFALLISDGSWEDGDALNPVGGIGAVLLDREDRSVRFFRWSAPRDLALVLASRRGGNPIHQLELCPVLVALKLWSVALQGRCTLCLVDNEASKAALVAGASCNATSAGIVADVDDTAAALGARLYYERVPSPSNLADPPSRGRPPPQVPGWPAATEVPVPKQLHLRLLLLLRRVVAAPDGADRGQRPAGALTCEHP